MAAATVQNFMFSVQIMRFLSEYDKKKQRSKFFSCPGRYVPKRYRAWLTPKVRLTLALPAGIICGVTRKM